MKRHGEVFVGVDAAELRHAVAVAEDGRRGEIRYMGEVGANTESVRRLAAKLEKRHGRGLHFCYEAGPTGHGLYRRLTELGHRRTVVAPSLIPRKPGDRVKTNRRDAQQLARLLRAGELGRPGPNRALIVGAVARRRGRTGRASRPRKTPCRTPAPSSRSTPPRAHSCCPTACSPSPKTPSASGCARPPCARSPSPARC